MRSTLIHPQIVWIGMCLLPRLVLAHQDPTGEIHPRVFVENEAFSIYFRSVGKTRENVVDGKMIFDEKGQVLVPKHLVTATAKGEEWQDPRNGTIMIPWTRRNQQGRSVFVLRTTTADLVKEQPLPLSAPFGADITSSWVDEKAIAVLWSEAVGEGEARVVLMKLSWIDRASFSVVATVEVGKPATIYDFPSASNLVWAEGKLWLAWVKELGKEDMEQSPISVTVLTCYDPHTKSLLHKELPQPSNWNTRISMGFLKGWLCLVWHCTKDGRYPGEAEIITAFEKVSP